MTIPPDEAAEARVTALIRPEPVGEPEADEGGRHRDRDGCAHEREVVVVPCIHPHGRHADVVHPGDGGTHPQRAGCQRPPGQRPAADDVKGQGGGGHRDQDRQEDQLGGVGDRDREVQGEHAHEVHAPDPDAHCDGAARDPRRALTAVGQRDAAGEIEGGVGRLDRDEN
jgi:hypothetical protein